MFPAIWDTVSNSLSSNVLLPISPLRVEETQQRYGGEVFRYARSVYEGGNKNKIRDESSASPGLRRLKRLIFPWVQVLGHPCMSVGLLEVSKVNPYGMQEPYSELPSLQCNFGSSGDVQHKGWSPNTSSSSGWFRRPREKLRHRREQGMAKGAMAFGSPCHKTTHSDPLLKIL